MPQTYFMAQPLLRFDILDYKELNINISFPMIAYELTVPETPSAVRFLPNGCIDLLIPLNNLGNVMLIGSPEKLRTIPLQSGSHYFGVRFAPGVFFWNQSMLPSALYDQIRSFSDLREYSPIIPENLARFESLEKKTSYFLDNILPCLKKQCLLPIVGHMLQRITQTHGMIQVADMASELSYSTRHINRLFIEALGYGPKSFCKYIRFQCALAEIEKMPGRNNSAFIQKTSYSDQAHFQREFKEFTGITPKQYIRLASRLPAA